MIDCKKLKELKLKELLAAGEYFGLFQNCTCIVEVENTKYKLTMYHNEDPKNIVKYTIINGISEWDDTLEYWKHMFEKLPFNRRRAARLHKMLKQI